MSARMGMRELENLDAELSRRARDGGSLRLALGRGLEALARKGGHHELGFSSLEAYALERCERSARWVQESRALARRLEALPEVRAALSAGRLSWSAAGIVAKVATVESHLEWLTLARALTVRQLERLAKEVMRGGVQGDSQGASSDSPCSEVEAFRTLTVTASRPDGWLFEATRWVVESVAGTRDADTVVEALVAEGFTTLQPWLPRPADVDCRKGGPDDAMDTSAPQETDLAEAAQQEWVDQQRRWREQAEEMCEERWLAAAAARSQCEEGLPRAESRFEGAAESVDAELRAIARELVSRDLVVGRLAEVFFRADGWRRLGYATEAQYVRERLGQGLTSVKSKRALARCAAALPALAHAIEEGEVGYEAARLVSSVANESTAEAWVVHAKQRTVRHLREEVNAVQMLASLTDRPMTPPDEPLMRDVEALESQIVSGAAFRNAGKRMSAPADDGATNLPAYDQEGTTAEEERIDGVEAEANEAIEDAAGQISSFENLPGSPARGAANPACELPALHVRERGAGKVTLKLRVRDGTFRLYRRLESAFVLAFGRQEPLIRFVCRALLETWVPTLGPEVAYSEIYARDCHRCRSPVCTRRDVTPHHLLFRAHGGDDSDDNLLTLCVWCHLHGIHEGRLRADRPATSPRFRVGRGGHTVVHGRRRARKAMPQTSPGDTDASRPGAR